MREDGCGRAGAGVRVRESGCGRAGAGGRVRESGCRMAGAGGRVREGGCGRAGAGRSGAQQDLSEEDGGWSCQCISFTDIVSCEGADGDPLRLLAESIFICLSRFQEMMNTSPRSPDCPRSSHL